MKYLCGALLLLVFNAPVFAQQLVPQDDSKDPCRRFKMRVLAPPDLDRAMVSKSGPSIDPKMVVNPCQTVSVQLPLILPDQSPNKRNNLVIVTPETPAPKLKFVPLQPAPFLNTIPKQPVP